MSSGPKQSARKAGGPRVRRDDKPRAARSDDKPRFSRNSDDKPRATRGEGNSRFTRSSDDKPRTVRSDDKPRFTRNSEDKARGGRSEARTRTARSSDDKPRKGRSQGKRFTRGSDGKPRIFDPSKPRFANKEDKPRAEGKARFTRGDDKPRGARSQAKTRPARTSDDKPRLTARSARGRDDTRSARDAGDKPRFDHAAPRPKKLAAKPSEREPRERYVAPKTPLILSKVSVEPHPGQWLFTTREGAEQDLIDELVLAKVVDPAPRKLGPALVLSPKLPKREGRHIELTFARQGLEILQSVKSHDLDEVVTRVARSLRNQLSEESSYALHVWVPDSAVGNPLASLAETLDQRIAAELARSLPELQRVDDATLRRHTQTKLAQVCVLDGERVVAGVMHGNRTPSLAKGGRTRVRVTGDLPSRAARKVEEALAWLGVAPGPGEVCVDLGAAPGGWTYVLAERRARVIAVDPALLRPDIAAKKGVRHVQESAFTFTPDEHVDWLFCDMAWRPLEAAALLAKWGRRHWARILVANIKLPMNKKVEILARVRHILETEGEWKHVRIKQLYHDREEITLTALKT